MIEIADINLTNLCNARCPQCQRTAEIGLGTLKDLPMITWSLQDFMNYFPKNCLDDIKEYSFCGTWGDPLMAKDIEAICDYILNNSQANILITTNGSIRSKDFYTRLGNKSGKRLTMIFDIDGVDETMHQKYRRGTSLNKVLNNMLALSRTDAIVCSQTILFKHNQHHQKQIKELATVYGSKNHEFCMSDRFDEDKFYFTNEDGEQEYLERYE